ncbi:TPA: hypothetical protein H1012_03425 [archaeon]|nr:hypothetical protein [Candidatus Naiadarchaeales archaeon SRR2090159.bin1288]
MKFNYYIGATAGSWLLLALILAVEFSAPFKGVLVSIFSHHWIGKAVLVTLAFAAAGFLFAGKKSVAGIADRDCAWYSIVSVLALIFLFFVLHFML